MGDIAPHRIGTCAEARHLAQRPSANRRDRRTGRNGLRARRSAVDSICGRWLTTRKSRRVCPGFILYRAAAEVLNPAAPFRGEGCSGKSVKKPDGICEQGGLGMRRSSSLPFPPWDARGEIRRGREPEGSAAFGRPPLHAAYIGDQLLRRENGRESFHPFEDTQVPGRPSRMRSRRGPPPATSSAAFTARSIALRGCAQSVTVPGFLSQTDDFSGKTLRAQSQSGGGANEARAHDHEAMDGHALRSFSFPQIFNSGRGGFRQTGEARRISRKAAPLALRFTFSVRRRCGQPLKRSLASHP